MIKLMPQAEPDDFARKVRQPGNAWLLEQHIPLEEALPSNTMLPSYWRACLDDLYQSYGGICAYLAVHFERATGGATVEHFIAKSQCAGLAYEWSNYRLASSIVNSRKRDYADVLDPFAIETGWFHLELVSGHIFPNPALDQALQQTIADTIARLGLDDGNNREMRARHFKEWIEELYTTEYLAIRSPLVHAEARRQNLLRATSHKPEHCSVKEG